LSKLSCPCAILYVRALCSSDKQALLAHILALVAEKPVRVHFLLAHPVHVIQRQSN